jgi:hypothetical protein
MATVQLHVPAALSPGKQPQVPIIWEAEGPQSRSGRYEEENLNFVGFEVLTAVVMKSPIFWDITLCSPLKVNRRFE